MDVPQPGRIIDLGCGTGNKRFMAKFATLLPHYSASVAEGIPFSFRRIFIVAGA